MRPHNSLFRHAAGSQQMLANWSREIALQQRHGCIWVCTLLATTHLYSARLFVRQIRVLRSCWRAQSCSQFAYIKWKNVDRAWLPTANILTCFCSCLLVGGICVPSTSRSATEYRSVSAMPYKSIIQEWIFDVVRLVIFQDGRTNFYDLPALVYTSTALPIGSGYSSIRDVQGACSGSIKPSTPLNNFLMSLLPLHQSGKVHACILRVYCLNLACARYI